MSQIPVPIDFVIGDFGITPSGVFNVVTSALGPWLSAALAAGIGLLVLDQAIIFWEFILRERWLNHDGVNPWYTAAGLESRELSDKEFKARYGLTKKRYDSMTRREFAEFQYKHLGIRENGDAWSWGQSYNGKPQENESTEREEIFPRASVVSDNGYNEWFHSEPEVSDEDEEAEPEGVRDYFGRAA